jgi:glycosyltransferase involved in cell wall biosynthesis
MSGTSVGVVVAVRDGERYLAEALESVLAQQPAPDEVVVVDDGSRDGTAEVLRRYRARLRIVSQAAIGQAAALNRGVAETRCDLLSFCDADDLWAPQRLERQLDALASDPTVDGVGGLIEQFSSPDAPEIARRVRVDTAPVAASLLGALLVRRTAFAVLGGFDNGLGICAPMDWVARARTGGVRLSAVDHVVLRRRIHPANQGLLRAEQARGELLRVARRDRERRRAPRGLTTTP